MSRELSESSKEILVIYNIINTLLHCVYHNNIFRAMNLIESSKKIQKSALYTGNQ